MAAIKARVATIEGTFLAPGVSKNGRLYTRENIAKAVDRLQGRIASGTATALTHHEAGDDSTRIVGRLTAAWSDPASGAAKFRADIADTTHGRDIAALIVGDKPYLGSVSIRGKWLGEMRSVRHGEESAVTADDLDVEGVDFTKSPGVSAARIERAQLAESAAPELIFESTDTSVSAIATNQGDLTVAETTEAVAPEATPVAEVAPAAEVTEEAPKDEATLPVKFVGLNESDVTAIAKAVAEAMKPAAPEVTESQAELSEAAFSSLVEKVTAAVKDSIRAELVQEGVVGRKGLVPGGGEKQEKPLHEMTAEERNAYAAEVWNARIHPEVTGAVAE